MRGRRMIDGLRKQEKKKDQRDKGDKPRNKRGDDDGSGTNRRYFEAAQDVCFAILNGPHPCPEKAAAEHANDQTHRDHLAHGSRAFRRMKRLGKDEKKHEWKEIIEHQNRAVARHQPQIALDLGKVRFHYSRSFFPVSSMKTSSSVGRLRWISTSLRPRPSIHLTSSTMAAAGSSVWRDKVRPASLKVYLVF